MKVFKIEIENYRLIKEFSMDLEKELSLVIGKTTLVMLVYILFTITN
jgi:predicted ATP-dependent endonuclease of OLD family